MTDARYFLIAGAGTARRIHHGSREAAERAFARLPESETLGAELEDATGPVRIALDLLEGSIDEDIAIVGLEGRLKHGWLRGYPLYAALCGAAAPKFQGFAPDSMDDYDIEFWGWRWGNVGLPSDDMSEELCDRIAGIVLRRERVVLGSGR